MHVETSSLITSVKRKAQFMPRYRTWKSLVNDRVKCHVALREFSVEHRDRRCGLILSFDTKGLVHVAFCFGFFRCSDDRV
jgi:hypothetical protein